MEEEPEDTIGNLPDDFYSGPSRTDIIYDDEYRRNRMLKETKNQAPKTVSFKESDSTEQTKNEITPNIGFENLFFFTDQEYFQS